MSRIGKLAIDIPKNIIITKNKNKHIETRASLSFFICLQIKIFAQYVVIFFTNGTKSIIDIATTFG